MNGLTPYKFEQFAGLNLLGDPQEVGPYRAREISNVRVDLRDRLLTRGGYTLSRAAK